MVKSGVSKTFRSQPAIKLRGDITVPGDKSISHRSLLLSAISEGPVDIVGFLQGQDCLATAAALKACGVDIQFHDNGNVKVAGVGLEGLQAPEAALDLGNSGTSIRLLAGIMAGQDFSCVLQGDASLSQRPMERVARPLRDMGAQVKTTEGKPPLTIHGVKTLKGATYAMPVASAQVKSCCLLAGIYANGYTKVIEPGPTRDHTEKMLRHFGYPVSVDGLSIALPGQQRLSAERIEVPGDISSAAFFLVAATLVPNSELVLRDVGVNGRRTGIIELLQAMGADIDLFNLREFGEEPVADIRVKTAKLQGITVPASLVASAIDEFPVLFIAAAFAEGETRIEHAPELRVKETDRLAVMAKGLTAAGVGITELAEGLIIQGGGYQACEVDAHGDHRIAMAFSVAGMVMGQDAMTIFNCDNVDTSFPDFCNFFNEIGANLQVIS